MDIQGFYFGNILKIAKQRSIS